MATPIGNLRDITLRALDVLKSVDVVAAEDTRVTRRLLTHYGIRTRVISSRASNERQAANGIVRLLSEGTSVALVTDAGTPLISDPGAAVVALARDAGFAVIPVPGPSALSAALSVCGQPASAVTFLGFLPSKRADRRAALKDLAKKTELLVLFEAPHRICDTLSDAAEILGSHRRIMLARELTKVFEESHVCSLADAQSWMKEKSERVRGEFVLVVEGCRDGNVESEAEHERVLGLLVDNLPVRQAVRLAVQITGGKKNALYARALEIEKLRAR